MKKVNKRLQLRAEQVRHLNDAQLNLVLAGVQVQCTPSCNQCSLYPECSGDTSSTTF
jgi:hypothetical protein